MNAGQFTRLRRRLQLTQKQFGEKLQFGSPQPRVSEIERGRVAVSPRIAQLCRYIEAAELESTTGRRAEDRQPS